MGDFRNYEPDCECVATRLYNRSFDLDLYANYYIYPTFRDDYNYDSEFIIHDFFDSNDIYGIDFRNARLIVAMYRNGTFYKNYIAPYGLYDDYNEYDGQHYITISNTDITYGNNEYQCYMALINTNSGRIYPYPQSGEFTLTTVAGVQHVGLKIVGNEHLNTFYGVFDSSSSSYYKQATYLDGDLTNTYRMKVYDILMVKMVVYNVSTTSSYTFDRLDFKVNGHTPSYLRNSSFNAVSSITLTPSEQTTITLQFSSYWQDEDNDEITVIYNNGIRDYQLINSNTNIVRLTDNYGVGFEAI